MKIGGYLVIFRISRMVDICGYLVICSDMALLQMIVQREFGKE